MLGKYLKTSKEKLVASQKQSADELSNGPSLPMARICFQSIPYNNRWRGSSLRGSMRKTFDEKYSEWEICEDEAGRTGSAQWSGGRT